VGTITFSSFASKFFNLSSTVNIQSTAAGTNTTVNAGAGDDVIIVGDAANTLNGIQGNLTINGGGGTNLVTLNDQASGGSLTYTLSVGTVTRTGMANITYASIQGLTLNSAGGVNTLNIESVAAGTPVTVSTEAGTNTINISPTAQNLNNIADALTLNDGGTDSATLFDQNDPANDTYTITSLTVQRTGSAPITYGSLQALVVNGSAAQDTNYNVESTSASTTVNAGNGLILVNISPTAQDLNTIAGSLAVNFGINPNDQITMFDVNNVGNPSNYSMSDTSTSVDTIPGFVLTYNFAANAGIVDVEDGTPGSAAINNTVNITCLFNGMPC
jgi:hypothetical protein